MTEAEALRFTIDILAAWAEGGSDDEVAAREAEVVVRYGGTRRDA